MRRDAVLGDVMHLAGAYLKLHAIGVRPHHGRVQGLIAVGLGHRYVVLESPGDRPPQRVDHSQGLVALLHVLDDYPKRHYVVDLVERYVLRLHLAPDAVVVLQPPVDLADDVVFAHLLRNHLAYLADVLLALALPLLDLLVDHVEDVGLEPLEGQVLQLDLHLLDAQSVGDGRVDVDRLLRDGHLLHLGHVLEGAHVVDSVGELDQDDAYVLGHGHDHLAEVLGLVLLLGGERDLGEFRHAVDEAHDLGAEEILYLLERRYRVLDRVVQERRGYGGDVELHPGEYPGNLHRVHEVGLPGAPRLPLMGARRKDVGLLYEVQVGLGVVGRDHVEDVVEADQSLSREIIVNS